MQIETTLSPAPSAQDLFVDVQNLITRLMAEKQLTAKDLANRLELPETVVARLLQGSDMTLRQLATVFAALGESAFIGRKYSPLDHRALAASPATAELASP